MLVVLNFFAAFTVSKLQLGCKNQKKMLADYFTLYVFLFNLLVTWYKIGLVIQMSFAVMSIISCSFLFIYCKS